VKILIRINLAVSPTILKNVVETVLAMTTVQSNTVGTFTTKGGQRLSSVSPVMRPSSLGKQVAGL
jgi:hypothetical protein